MTQSSFAATGIRTGGFRVRAVIGRSAWMLWRNFPSFFVVGLIASLPILLIAKAQTTEPAGPGDLSRLLWETSSMVLYVMLSTFGQAVIAHATFQDMRRRGTARLVESLNVGLRRFWPLIGLVLVSLVTVTMLGFILLVVPGLILCTIWFVGLPACIVEQLGPWTSLRRSLGLTRGHRWKVFGLTLLLLVPGLGTLLVETWLAALASPVVRAVGELMFYGIWAAFISVILIVTYHDLRMAKEGTDIEQIAGVFD